MQSSLRWTAAVLVMTIGVSVTMSQATQSTLVFESDCLDMDTSTIVDTCNHGVPQDPQVESDWDILVAYHADRPTHAVILPNILSGVQIAHLQNAVYEDVTVADAAEAQFAATIVDEAIDVGVVVLIRTGQGAVYKLGNASEDPDRVSFDYEQLTPAP